MYKGNACQNYIYIYLTKSKTRDFRVNTKKLTYMLES